MDSTNKNQYVLIQLGPEPIEFEKIIQELRGIILLDTLDDKNALVELVGIEPQDVLDKFSNILLEPNISYSHAKINYIPILERIMKRCSLIMKKWRLSMLKPRLRIETSAEQKKTKFFNKDQI